MRRHVSIVLALFVLWTGTALAQTTPATAGTEAPSEPENSLQQQADAFIRLYNQLCVQHIVQLDTLRQQLQNQPPLEPYKAEYFLQGIPGKAWPISGMGGTYVIAIPDEVDICSVYALRADTTRIETQFQAIATDAPADMQSSVYKDDYRIVESNVIHHQSYTWTLPEAPRQILLILSTSSNPPEAVPQSMASITITGK